ncbi:discoidin domain-containing protein [Candidatus Sumerlaeota bacterium]|nr:discoidin domain-containing protein [Candidatus Sumerlaeota bacterium]
MKKNRRQFSPKEKVAIMRKLFFSFAFLSVFNAFCIAEPEMDISGKWRFALDPQNVGKQEQWFIRNLEGTIHLPGSLQEQGFGEEITTETPWTLGGTSRKWLSDDKYAPYRKPGDIKWPYTLQPLKSYVGIAWYQRDVEIPESWKDRRIVLFLERPHWGTTLWIDERCVGSSDALGVPHEYDLGANLASGSHRLTIRVDNHVLVDVGLDAHSVSDHTQTNWNGVAGSLKLRTTPKVWIDDFQAFPLPYERKVLVRIMIGNTTGMSGSGVISLLAQSYNAVDTPNPPEITVPAKWNASGGRMDCVYDLGSNALLWDEFHPALYRLTATLSGGQTSKTVTFGLRNVDVKDKQITVNGRKIFLRGTLECCIFPLTGYPPTDVESWRRIIRIAKSHGLNHLRFHSWCPPEAAFIAGDEAGFYFQVECSIWSHVFAEGRALDKWLYEESERMIKYIGNHPSFLLMVASNEPGGKGYENFLGEWVNHWKETDARRLYAAGSGWPDIPDSQFLVTYKARGYPTRAKNGENAGDYGDFLSKQTAPIISHELGQYCVFPNLDEISKYTGVLRAKNFEIARDFMERSGLLEQAHQFLLASGRLQTMFYKEDIEAALRTPGWAGVQLLDLHDFPGQGTALVGTLDPFWDSKGYVSPEEYRRFFGETVLLARMQDRIFQNTDTFKAGIDVCHYGERDIEDSLLKWEIIDKKGGAIVSGTFPGKNIPVSSLTNLGEITLPLDRFPRAAALTLRTSLEGTDVINQWNFWAYPKHADVQIPAGIVVTDKPDRALASLEKGEKVLLFLEKSRIDGNAFSSLNPVFWNKNWFPNQRVHTLGILCDSHHPLFAEFPTDFHGDWQWQDILNHSKPMILDGLPLSFRPLIQPIDDWNSCRKLGLLFEARIGKGRIMVSSMNLKDDLEKRPAASQLLSSVLKYMSGGYFTPKQVLEPEQLLTIFREPSFFEKLDARIMDHDSAAPGYEASHVLDNDPETIWHTPWGDGAPDYPHRIAVAWNASIRLSGISILPRQDVSNALIKDYKVEISVDGENWEEMAKGTFEENWSEKKILFTSSQEAKYLKFTGISGYRGDKFAAIADLNLIPALLKPVNSEQSSMSMMNQARPHGIGSTHNLQPASHHQSRRWCDVTLPLRSSIRNQPLTINNYPLSISLASSFRLIDGNI